MMFNVKDGNGYGTHCAGAITSCMYGVVKGVNVIAVKVFGSNPWLIIVIFLGLNLRWCPRLLWLVLSLLQLVSPTTKDPLRI
jgi:hypothetical protein